MENSKHPVYIYGSLWKHLWKTSAGTFIGLGTLFFSDFINLLFLNIANTHDTISALGFSLTILLFMKGLSVAIAILLPPLIGYKIGKKDWLGAATSLYSILWTALFLSLLSIIACLPFIKDILHILGARGNVMHQAYQYCFIIICMLPLSVIEFSLQGILLVFGDIKSYTITNVATGILNILLDALLILVFHWGIMGAALSIVLTRLFILVWIILIIKSKHHLPYELTLKKYRKELKKIIHLFIPSLLSEIEMPTNVFIITYFIGKYGAGPIFSWAIIARIYLLFLLIPMSVIQGLASIVGQNLGAKKIHRVKHAIFITMLIIVAHAIFITLIFHMVSPYIQHFFHIPPTGLPNFTFFITYEIPVTSSFGMFFLLFGVMFITFGRPIFNVIFYWSATLSIIPITWLLTPMLYSVSVQAASITTEFVGGIAATIGFYYYMRYANIYKALD